MHFASVTLKNFGPFRDERFSFVPHDINWVVGANASGKTQLIGAILVAIVGAPAVGLEPEGNGPASVELEIRDGDQVETAQLDVYQAPNGRVKVDKTTGALSVAILAELSRPDGQELVVREHDRPRGSTNATMLLEGVPSSLHDHPEFANVQAAIEAGAHAISGGQQALVTLVAQCVQRLTSTVRLPLIVDAWSIAWASGPMDFALALLQEVARVSQVILVTHMDLTPYGRSIRLVQGDASVKSLAYFKATYAPSRPRLKRVTESRWNLASRFQGDENRACEFKEIKGTNPLGSIKNTVDEYVVAFLNAGRQQEGAIFWGIRDENRAIVGVQLDAKDRDQLRRVVVEQLLKISPPLAPTQYQMDLHPVTESGRPVEDLYVVEVRVPAVRRMVLFATGGNEVFVKTDAGKKKLTPLELQYEVLARAGVEPDF